MSDPFQRAKDIRSGKLDSEIPAYEELTGWLQRLPVTWLPGLLMRVVHICIVRKVFVSKEGMMRVIDKCADDAANPTSMLRE